MRADTPQSLDCELCSRPRTTENRACPQHEMERLRAEVHAWQKQFAEVNEVKDRLRAQNEQLRKLLARWLDMSGVSHNIHGQPIPLMHDTREALGMSKLDVFGRE